MEIYGSDIGGGVLHEGGSLNGWKLPTRMTGHVSNLWHIQEVWIIFGHLGAADIIHKLGQGLQSLFAGASRWCAPHTQGVVNKFSEIQRNSAKFSEIQRNSGNIQGTFREHSGNVEWTFIEHLVNIQWTVWEHSVNIQWTFRESWAMPVCAPWMSVRVDKYMRRLICGEVGVRRSWASVPMNLVKVERCE